MTTKEFEVSPNPIDLLTPFALQVLLSCRLSFDDCGVFVENVRGVKTNLYSFPSDKVAEDLMTRLRDLIESFNGRRGKMKAAYVALASLNGDEQLEAIVTALVCALNSKGYRKAKVKERQESSAERNGANREVLSATEYSRFRPLRNKGTAKEYRPAHRNEFDQPRSTRELKKFKPLELPREQQLLQTQDGAPKRPTLDPYKATDIIVPSDLSAWQLRLLIKTLS